jgi:hypothetical protein
VHNDVRSKIGVEKNVTKSYTAMKMLEMGEVVFDVTRTLHSVNADISVLKLPMFFTDT